MVILRIYSEYNSHSHFALNNCSAYKDNAVSGLNARTTHTHTQGLLGSFNFARRANQSCKSGGVLLALAIELSLSWAPARNSRNAETPPPSCNAKGGVVRRSRDGVQLIPGLPNRINPSYPLLPLYYIYYSLRLCYTQTIPHRLQSGLTISPLHLYHLYIDTRPSPFVCIHINFAIDRLYICSSTTILLVNWKFLVQINAIHNGLLTSLKCDKTPTQEVVVK